MANEKKDYAQIMAENVIAALEKGTAPWQRPWEPGEAPNTPMNPSTGNAYKGWNRVWLSAAAPDNDPRWLTYKQAEKMGAQVREGEKATPIFIWKTHGTKLLTDDKNKPILDAEGRKQYKIVPYERPYRNTAFVFHASQIDGLPELEKKEPIPEWQRHSEAERILAASQAPIFHDQANRAYYTPTRDQIHLPQREQFATPDAYYATALHEFGHSTGHSSRLDRDLDHPFGSAGYAIEELRAEMFSLMLGQEIGIGHDPEQHHAYIGSWIKALKEDPEELFRAARDAQSMMDYTHALAKEYEQEHSPKEEKHTYVAAMEQLRQGNVTEAWATAQEDTGLLPEVTQRQWVKAAYENFTTTDIDPQATAAYIQSNPNPEIIKALDQTHFVQALERLGWENDETGIVLACAARVGTPEQFQTMQGMAERYYVDGARNELVTRYQMEDALKPALQATGIDMEAAIYAVSPALQAAIDHANTPIKSPIIGNMGEPLYTVAPSGVTGIYQWDDQAEQYATNKGLVLTVGTLEDGNSQFPLMTNNALQALGQAEITGIEADSLTIQKDGVEYIAKIYRTQDFQVGTHDFSNETFATPDKALAQTQQAEASTELPEIAKAIINPNGDTLQRLTIPPYAPRGQQFQWDEEQQHYADKKGEVLTLAKLGELKHDFELETDKALQALGEATITDVGSENIYIQKDGVEYFAKIYRTEDFQVGTHDFSNETFEKSPVKQSNAALEATAQQIEQWAIQNIIQRVDAALFDEEAEFTIFEVETTPAGIQEALEAHPDYGTEDFSAALPLVSHQAIRKALIGTEEHIALPDAPSAEHREAAMAGVQRIREDMQLAARHQILDKKIDQLNDEELLAAATSLGYKTLNNGIATTPSDPEKIREALKQEHPDDAERVLENLHPFVVEEPLKLPEEWKSFVAVAADSPDKIRHGDDAIRIIETAFAAYGDTEKLEQFANWLDDSTRQRFEDDIFGAIESLRDFSIKSTETGAADLTPADIGNAVLKQLMDSGEWQYPDKGWIDTVAKPDSGASHYFNDPAKHADQGITVTLYPDKDGNVMLGVSAYQCQGKRPIDIQPNGSTVDSDYTPLLQHAITVEDTPESLLALIVIANQERTTPVSEVQPLSEQALRAEIASASLTANEGYNAQESLENLESVAARNGMTVSLSEGQGEYGGTTLHYLKDGKPTGVTTELLSGDGKAVTSFNGNRIQGTGYTSDPEWQQAALQSGMDQYWRETLTPAVDELLKLVPSREASPDFPTYEAGIPDGFINAMSATYAIAKRDELPMQAISVIAENTSFASRYGMTDLPPKEWVGEIGHLDIVGIQNSGGRELEATDEEADYWLIRLHTADGMEHTLPDTYRNKADAEDYAAILTAIHQQTLTIAYEQDMAKVENLRQDVNQLIADNEAYSPELAEKDGEWQLIVGIETLATYSDETEATEALSYVNNVGAAIALQMHHPERIPEGMDAVAIIANNRIPSLAEQEAANRQGNLYYETASRLEAAQDNSSDKAIIAEVIQKLETAGFTQEGQASYVKDGIAVVTDNSALRQEPSVFLLSQQNENGTWQVNVGRSTEFGDHAETSYTAEQLWQQVSAEINRLTPQQEQEDQPTLVSVVPNLSPLEAFVVTEINKEIAGVSKQAQAGAVWMDQAENASSNHAIAELLKGHPDYGTPDFNQQMETVSNQAIRMAVMGKPEIPAWKEEMLAGEIVVGTTAIDAQLTAMGYNLDELDKDNPYNQWMQDTQDGSSTEEKDSHSFEVNPLSPLEAQDTTDTTQLADLAAKYGMDGDKSALVEYLDLPEADQEGFGYISGDNYFVPRFSKDEEGVWQDTMPPTREMHFLPMPGQNLPFGKTDIQSVTESVTTEQAPLLQPSRRYGEQDIDLFADGLKVGTFFAEEKDFQQAQLQQWQTAIAKHVPDTVQAVLDEIVTKAQQEPAFYQQVELFQRTGLATEIYAIGEALTFPEKLADKPEMVKAIGDLGQAQSWKVAEELPYLNPNNIQLPKLDIEKLTDIQAIGKAFDTIEAKRKELSDLQPDNWREQRAELEKTEQALGKKLDSLYPEPNREDPAIAQKGKDYREALANDQHPLRTVKSLTAGDRINTPKKPGVAGVIGGVVETVKPQSVTVIDNTAYGMKRHKISKQALKGGTLYRSSEFYGLSDKDREKAPDKTLSADAALEDAEKQPSPSVVTPSTTELADIQSRAEDLAATKPQGASQEAEDLQRMAETIKDKQAGEGSNTKEPEPVAARNSEQPRPAQEKTFLAIPFADKDKAKKAAGQLPQGGPALGWDSTTKSWYANVGADLNKLKQWLPENVKDRQERPDPPEVEFAKALKDAGLELPAAPIMDGTKHRVPALGDKAGQKSGEYVGYTDGHPAGFIRNFRDESKTGSWKYTGNKVDQESVQDWKAINADREAQKAQQRAATQETAAMKTAQAWENLRPHPHPEHPYLVAKGLQGTFEQVQKFWVRQDDNGNLVVPARDKEGKLWNMQRIGGSGWKGFEKDAKLQGCFHVIGGRKALKEQGNAEPVIISTGFGTAATIHLATGKPVIVAFNDNNLKAVAEEFKKIFPERTQAIFGDDDQHLPLLPRPLANSGREKATEAAEAVGGVAVFPRFASGTAPTREFSDFNDLQRQQGMKAVQRQVEQGLAQARSTVTTQKALEQAQAKEKPEKNRAGGMEIAR